MITPTAVELATALLDVFEGPVTLEAKCDHGGVWYIGRGHTAGVKAGMTCTAEQAAKWFLEDQTPLFALVRDRHPLAQAAYVSFGYNVGEGALKKVLAGLDSIMNPIHQTDRRGVRLAGLTSRRALEDLLTEFE